MALMTRLVTPGRPLPWCVVDATRYCSFNTSCCTVSPAPAGSADVTYQYADHRIVIGVVCVVGSTLYDVQKVQNEGILHGHCTYNVGQSFALQDVLPKR
jgi:hypothetical protein